MVMFAHEITLPRSLYPIQGAELKTLTAPGPRFTEFYLPKTNRGDASKAGDTEDCNARFAANLSDSEGLKRHTDTTRQREQPERAERRRHP